MVFDCNQLCRERCVRLSKTVLVLSHKEGAVEMANQILVFLARFGAAYGDMYVDIAIRAARPTCPFFIQYTSTVGDCGHCPIRHELIM